MKCDFTPEEVRTHIAAGGTISGFADLQGVDEATVAKRMDAWGIPRTPPGRPRRVPADEELGRMCADGLTPAEIAIASGVLEGAVYAALRAAGLKPNRRRLPPVYCTPIAGGVRLDLGARRRIVEITSDQLREMLARAEAA